MADEINIKRVKVIETIVAVLLGLLCLGVLVTGLIATGRKEGTFFDKFEVIVIWIEGVGTIAIFTMLYRENPISRFFEHLLIGVSVGYGAAFTWTNILWPSWATSCFGIDGKPMNLWWLLALIPGALWYFQLSRKYNWISKLIICFFMGLGAGAVFKATFNILIGPDGQITRTIMPLLRVGEPGWSFWTFIFQDFIIFFVSLCVLSYFFFSFRHEKNLPLRAGSRLGRYFLMIMFGAVFGSTVMGRMSLLIDRLTFLFKLWLMT
jgi:hypothetical protein